MPEKDRCRFKVIGTNGIYIYFSTRKFCQQYIKSKGGNKKDGSDKKYNPHYFIIEYGGQNKKRNKDSDGVGKLNGK